MKNKFLKRGYGLMAALVLTILVAGPHAVDASTDLVKNPDTELLQPNGGCEHAFCMF